MRGPSVKPRPVLRCLGAEKSSLQAAPCCDIRGDHICTAHVTLTSLDGELVTLPLLGCKYIDLGTPRSMLTRAGQARGVNPPPPGARFNKSRGGMKRYFRGIIMDSVVDELVIF